MLCFPGSSASMEHCRRCTQILSVQDQLQLSGGSEVLLLHDVHLQGSPPSHLRQLLCRPLLYLHSLSLIYAETVSYILSGNSAGQ